MGIEHIVALIFFISGSVVERPRALEYARQITQITSNSANQRALIALAWNESRFGIDGKGRFFGCGYQRNLRDQSRCAFGTFTRNLRRCNGSWLAAFSRYNHGNGCEITSYGIRINSHVHRMVVHDFPWLASRNGGCFYRMP